MRLIKWWFGRGCFGFAFYCWPWLHRNPVLCFSRAGKSWGVGIGRWSRQFNGGRPRYQGATQAHEPRYSPNNGADMSEQCPTCASAERHPRVNVCSDAWHRPMTSPTQDDLASELEDKAMKLAGGLEYPIERTLEWKAAAELRSLRARVGVLDGAFAELLDEFKKDGPDFLKCANIVGAVVEQSAK